MAGVAGNPVAEQLHAVRDAAIVLQGTREARYMPFPVNHLRGRGWTRRALERTFPTTIEAF